jgi:hypothetical protein
VVILNLLVSYFECESRKETVNPFHCENIVTYLCDRKEGVSEITVTDHLCRQRLRMRSEKYMRNCTGSRSVAQYTIQSLQF